ncbi:hypothetical protein BDZ89DRAFT_1067287, partial [Hymenopellis radicata]
MSIDSFHLSLLGEVFALTFLIGGFLDRISSSSHPGFASSSMSATSKRSGRWSLSCILSRMYQPPVFPKGSPCLQCFEDPSEQHYPFARFLCEEGLRICHS